MRLVSFLHVLCRPCASPFFKASHKPKRRYSYPHCSYGEIPNTQLRMVKLATVRPCRPQTCWITSSNRHSGGLLLIRTRRLIYRQGFLLSLTLLPPSYSPGLDHCSSNPKHSYRSPSHRKEDTCAKRDITMVVPAEAHSIAVQVIEALVD